MKQVCCRHHDKCGVGLRIVLLVLGVIVLSMVLLSCKKDSSTGSSEKQSQENVAHITSEPAQSIPGRALQKAMGVECQNNLQQIRMLINSKKDEDTASGDTTEVGTGTGFPASLDNIPEARQIKECPISHKPYVYDPSTGQVHCTFPGHENF